MKKRRRSRFSLRPLFQVATVFLRAGAAGFGGPQAHIAMLQKLCVKELEWIDDEQFNEGLTTCSLLPGPTSTELAIWLGFMRAGFLGGVVGGIAFTLPAFVMVFALAWLFERYGHLPTVDRFLSGVQPAVIAVILATCLRLAAPFRRDARSVCLAAFAIWATSVSPESVALVLIASGLLGLLMARPPTGAAAVHVWPVFLYFLSTGVVVFGGGMVIVPLTQHDLIERFHWLTADQFVDALGAGLAAPSPLVMASAFLGYRAAGPAGAFAAATAIFIPSFVFVLFAVPLVRRISQSSWWKAFATGVAPAVVGTIVASIVPLFHACIGPEPLHLDVVKAGIFLVALVVLIRGRMNPALVVLAGGIVGLLASVALDTIPPGRLPPGLHHS